jgi:hypothetical protein
MIRLVRLEVRKYFYFRFILFSYESDLPISYVNNFPSLLLHPNQSVCLNHVVAAPQR